MNDFLSNVRVISNLYPVTTAKTVQLPGLPGWTSGVIDDPKFRRRIWCKKSLRILSSLKAGGINDDRRHVENLLENNLVEPAQIEACWDDGCCVDCLLGERPIGAVSKGNNITVECRCDKPNCRVKNSSNS